MAVTTTVLRYVQAILLTAGVVLAVQWARHPDQHYDAWLGVSVAIVPLLELAKRKFDEPHDKKAQKEIVEGSVRQALKDYEDAKNLAAEQKKSQAAQAAKERERPTVDPMLEKYTKIVALRSNLESRMQEYAKLRGIEPAGKSPSELLGLLTMPDSWKQGIADFLKHTDDPAHEPQAMVDWAAENAHVYIGVLDTLLGNQKSIPQTK